MMAAQVVEKIVLEAESRMKKAISVLRDEFLTIRTGRASTALLDRISTEYYGTRVPLKQLATLSVPEPRLLVIHPYDKNSIPGIEKAILQSDLGITPTNDGTVIRLPVPPLTEERRKDLIKIARGMAEEGRVSIRNIRRDSNEHLKSLEKEKQISEDDERRAEEEIQKKTDKYIAEIGEMLKNKEQEIMEV
jgi:ribosome recycling factor